MKNLLLLSLFFCTVSCSKYTGYNKNVSIPDRKWDYNNVLSFGIDNIDTSSYYDIYIFIRHSHEYEFSNLYLKVHEFQDGITDTVNRIEIKLAEKDGKWLGKSAGNLYSLSYLYKENIKSEDTSAYHINVEQNMRQNPLKHISDIGIEWIKKTK